MFKRRRYPQTKLEIKHRLLRMLGMLALKDLIETPDFEKYANKYVNECDEEIDVSKITPSRVKFFTKKTVQRFGKDRVVEREFYLVRSQIFNNKDIPEPKRRMEE